MSRCLEHPVINRGSHHVIFDDTELVKQIPKPVCLQVLRQLMWYYEERSRRQAYQQANRGYQFGRIQMEGIITIERAEFDKLMDLCSKWLRAPLRLDFTKEEKNETRKRRCVDGSRSGYVLKINMSET